MTKRGQNLKREQDTKVEGRGKTRGEEQRARERMRGVGSRTERWSSRGKRWVAEQKERDKDRGREQDKGVEEATNSDVLQD